MKAVVFHGVGDIRLEDVPEPRIEQPTDAIESRLDMAREQGAEVVNFDAEDPVKCIKDLTGGIGVDRAIDAVGVDAVHPHHGPAAEQARQQEQLFQQEREQAMGPNEPKPGDGSWHPGDAPSQALRWAIEGLAKAGTLSIIGVYPETMQAFPIGKAMMKNLTIKMGNCNHRKYIPKLVEMVRSGIIDPREVLTKREQMLGAIDAYKAFDQRQPGWVRVELVPGQEAAQEWTTTERV